MDKQFYINILLFVIFVYVVKSIFFKNKKYEGIENIEVSVSTEVKETKEEKRKRLLNELFNLQKEYEKRINDEVNEEIKNALNLQIEEISMKIKEEIDSL
jgi:rRNA maturation endonuclease Nob1